MQETEKETLNSDSIVANSDLQDFSEGDPKNNAGPSHNNDRQGSLQNTVNNIHQLRKKRRFRALVRRRARKLITTRNYLKLKIKSYLSSKRAHNVEDSDYQFLVSLLPYLHEVPAQNNLRVRMEMMNVLLTEQAERNNLRQPISNLQPTRSPSFSSISSSHTCSNDFTMSDPSTSSFYENFDPQL
ncbi:hypothetical protein C0J52_17410 [Blattella germanica]|nr:hypothetical protein C0J52_17410 [Blattella germanica]